MKKAAPSLRISMAALFLAVLSPVALIPGGRLLGAGLMLLAAALFLWAIVLGLREVQARGQTITIVPHGIMVAAWAFGTIAFAVLAFGPEMSSDAIVAVRLAIIVAVVIFFAAFFAARARRRPPEGPAT